MSIEKLSRHHSWKLERISPLTFPHDIVVKLKYLGKKEVNAVASSIKRGDCYRCRIGKGRYYFGETADEAIAAALKAEKNS